MPLSLSEFGAREDSDPSRVQQALQEPTAHKILAVAILYPSGNYETPQHSRSMEVSQNVSKVRVKV